MSERTLKVAVLGCGAVGSQVVRLLTEQHDDLTARVGAPVELVGVAVRRLDAPREVEVPEGLLTTDAAALVSREDVDIVVEVIAEQPSTGERRQTHTARVVFVAIDDYGRPKRVPRLVPETEDERARYAAAEQYRREHRTS